VVLPYFAGYIRAIFSNVKAIREATEMSQQKFCATFGISVGTLSRVGW